LLTFSNFSYAANSIHGPPKVTAIKEEKDNRCVRNVLWAEVLEVDAVNILKQTNEEAGRLMLAAARLISWHTCIEARSLTFNL